MDLREDINTIPVRSLATELLGQQRSFGDSFVPMESTVLWLHTITLIHPLMHASSCVRRFGKMPGKVAKRTSSLRWHILRK